MRTIENEEKKNSEGAKGGADTKIWRKNDGDDKKWRKKSKAKLLEKIEP